jgi:uncharacterized membrane protein YphA (DoxX/SURF4 family)
MIRFMQRAYVAQPVGSGPRFDNDREITVDLAAPIGRILSSLLFLGSAFGGHFGATDATAGYAESRGVKGARMLVLLSGAQLAAGALMVLLGTSADLGALRNAAFTLPTAFLIHHFWTDQDPMTQQMEMTQFMRTPP